ncbi:MAG: TdeIII family type II restriction endonuclease [Candidatus Aenigmarchaeota archaeon]|nr:TdeIII family type II restriction endonuclease [Candidatus Aenigmarchaeota archaeon]
MALSSVQKEEIRNLLRRMLKNKLQRYARETTSMPFLTKLIQDEQKVASYSFMHSISTSLGISVYEDVSLIVAKPQAESVAKKVDMNGTISKEQKSVIASIVTELVNGTRKTNKGIEIKEVLKASSRNGKQQEHGKIADFFMKRNGKEYYIEIKTVKPNIDVFEESKTKLLEWIARKQKPIVTILAFPYNPYYPDPYNRFTHRGVLEVGKEFLVGEEYWDFLGGKGTFKDIMDVFDEVGKELHKEILAKIDEVAKTKMKI